MPNPFTLPAELAEVIKLHREMFGGWTMTAGPAEQPGNSQPAGQAEPAGDAGEGDGDKPLGPNGEKALAAEREARKQSDAKLAKFEAQMAAFAKALGVEPDAKSGDDKVEALAEAVRSLSHNSAVDRVAREHGITESGDLALLREQSNEEAMGRLALRLKPAMGDGKPETKTPKPDPSVGMGAGDPGGAKPSRVAEVMAERRKAREAK